MTPSSWVLWAVDSFPVKKSIFFEGMALDGLIMLQRVTRYPGVCAEHKLGMMKQMGYLKENHEAMKLWGDQGGRVDLKGVRGQSVG